MLFREAGHSGGVGERDLQQGAEQVSVGSWASLVGLRLGPELIF